MNGSGLQDESSFVYDPERLADSRQPLQPDLDKVIKDYIASHPSLKKGDLVTISEPGLSGYQLCIDQECATTSLDGNFSVLNKTGITTALLKITDPNADKPALAMRYINEWKGTVIVPAYTKDTDIATLKKLTVIPNCSDDIVQVCRQDDKTLLVKEQHLNDTKEIPISNGEYINNTDENEIGLMQGFLSYPFAAITDFFIWSYVDLDYKIGSIRDWSGEKIKAVDAFIDIKSPRAREGISDQHQGIDFNMKIGNPIFAVMGGEIISIVGDDGKNTHQMVLEHEPDLTFQTNYAHYSLHVLDKNEKVYRGEIIAISGNHVAGNFIAQPHLHLSYWKIPDDINAPCIPYPSGGCAYRDTDLWRDLQNKNSINYWTVDNLPQFPLVN
jgi:murein DD-endopeptidase MepM/ murein hydrolase activator NlpD